MSVVSTGPLSLLATLACHVTKTSIDLEVTGQCLTQPATDLLYKLCSIRLAFLRYTINTRLLAAATIKFS